jgi:sugar phosphate permease
MASTLPVTLVLPAIGWRGIFLLLAGASVVSAITVLLVVPDAPAQAPVEDWRSNLRGVREVYRDPAFWSLAPLSACIVGTAFAVHGLWAVRWLAEVDHYDTHRVASAVFAMGTGLTLGAGLIGVVGERARRRGMQPTTTFGLACALFIVLQLMALERVQLPAWLLWGAIASFGSITVLSYSIIGEMFPPERIGRANGALNVLHLGMAFVLQYGMGVVASFWHADFFGHLPAIAYRAAFSLPLLLEFLALTWFVFALTASQRRIGEQADDEVSMATPEVSP